MLNTVYLPVETWASVREGTSQSMFPWPVTLNEKLSILILVIVGDKMDFQLLELTIDCSNSEAVPATMPVYIQFTRPQLATLTAVTPLVNPLYKPEKFTSSGGFGSSHPLATAVSSMLMPKRNVTLATSCVGVEDPWYWYTPIWSPLELMLVRCSWYTCPTAPAPGEVHLLK